MSATLDALLTARVRLHEETTAAALCKERGYTFDEITARRERAHFAALVDRLTNKLGTSFYVVSGRDANAAIRWQWVIEACAPTDAEMVARLRTKGTPFEALAFESEREPEPGFEAEENLTEAEPFSK